MRLSMKDSKLEILYNLLSASTFHQLMEGMQNVVDQATESKHTENIK